MRRAWVGMTILAVAIVAGWIFLNPPSGMKTYSPVRSAANESIDAAATGHGSPRKTSSVLHDDWPADEYLIVFHKTKVAADNGDSIAQLNLSEIYERCSQYALNPEKYMKWIDSLVSREAGRGSASNDLAKRRDEQCRAVMSTGPVTYSDYTKWLMRSAESGNLVANARLMTRSINAPSPEDARKVAALAIAGKDGRALFETGELLARIQDGGAMNEYQAVSGPGIGTYAWGVVGCRIGMDCTRTSNVMDAICINTGKCTYSSYEEFVRNELVPTGERGKLEEAVKYISSKLEFSSNH